jgi:flagellar protein FlaG
MISQTVNTNTGSKSSSIGVSLQHNSAAQSATSTTVQVEVSKETVDRVVHQLETQSQSLRRDLQFNVDDSTGRVIVTVRDSETDEVIRQIPSEELLALAQHLADALEDDASGFLFESEA